MARLRPYPFGALVRRAFTELDRRQAIFDLPQRSFFLHDTKKDLSVTFHGRPASTPFGPAAGPQSQLAQNIVLSWLGGARIIELKTVQIDDELAIPRPCIDIQTIGYNIEWSQELKIEESVDEYVKASMLIEMLVASGKLPLPPSATRILFDVSLGYDFAGISSPRVRAFVESLRDAHAIVDRLRDEIPDDFSQYRDIPFATHISDSLTLSTFHGCPPTEIERIVEFLLRVTGLHVTIKLNPMLLGKEETLHLLHEQLGYHEVVVPDSAFDRDTTWPQAIEFIPRLGRVAEECGLGLGVKFTNTLIVENHRSFFPTSTEMYLSGPPLHVLAIHLVRRFRREFGDRYPVSFSAGIDRVNFADAVALGLTPVTVCSDLLKPGGYARSQGYLQTLVERMNAVGADDIDEFIIRAYGLADAALDRAVPRDSANGRAVREALANGTTPRAACGEDFFARWRAQATLLNTERYVDGATVDPRYRRAQNVKTPRKIGRTLRLFDCITCDKCVPVCPNDANFTFSLPRGEVRVLRLQRQGGRWLRLEEGSFRIDEKHQIGTFADFCNECGNCDVFCPEDGGPYVIKPRFFSTRSSWTEAVGLDGFFIERDGPSECVLGRFSGSDYRLEVTDGRVHYSGAGFAVVFSESDPEGTIDGEATAEVDLTYFEIMNALRRAILSSDEINYVNLLPENVTRVS